MLRGGGRAFIGGNVRKRDRWFSIAELADLMKLPHKNKAERRRYVWRTIRGLERRDGQSYMKRLNPGRGKLYVSLSVLEQLMPWERGTLSGIRADLDGLGVRVKRLKRRVDRHDIDIKGLAEWMSKHAQLMGQLPALMVPKHSKNTAGKTDH